jgi:hypothetical protein
MDTARHRYRTVLGAASLVLGPGLMSLGDVMHPAEDLDAAAQVAIVAQSAGRWYSAHLLLFVGLLLLVPGLLSLSAVAMDRKPRAGYAARVLLLASVGAFSAVFAFEMLIGRFISKGADQATAVVLLETFQSGVFVALAPGLLAFFIGTGLAVMSLASAAGPFRWPALGLALGAVLILGEIILAEVRLSQIGNLVSLAAGIAFARALLRSAQLSPHSR